MAEITLVADPGRPAGSRESRRLRASGRIPAVIYGHGIAPIAVSVDARDLRAALGTEAGSRALLELHVGSDRHLAMARQLQRHPVRHTVTHVDFQVVRRDEVVSAEIPVVLVGEPVAVHRGDGLVDQEVQAITKLCNEHRIKGYDGRFGPGLPRVNDGSMLFLMHLLSKRKPVSKSVAEGGTRIGIILSGSPLFNGGAGSGESEIRRWILENDWLEAIVALPTDMFYNTGIGTYVWILSTNKEEHRRRLVQLIDATGIHTAMRKSLGSKRKWLTDEQITEIARIHDAFEASVVSKIFNTTDFGYRRITVERPLQLKFSVTPEKLAIYQAAKGAEYAEQFAMVSGEFLRLAEFLAAAKIKKLGKAATKAVLSAFGEHCPDAEIITDEKGKPEADTNLRDFENVPLNEPIDDYFAREVLPHVPDAWIDTSKKDEKDGHVGIVGYEINFNRYFYQYVPPRSLAEIDADLKAVEGEIEALLKQVTA